MNTDPETALRDFGAIREAGDYDPARRLLFIRYVARLGEPEVASMTLAIRADCRKLHHEIVRLFDGLGFNQQVTRWSLGTRVPHERPRVNWYNFQMSQSEREQPALSA